MSLQFKMKRTRSPDLVGISNYKRQRLIQDFENLSLGTQSADRVIFHEQTDGISAFGDVLNEKLWSVVEREMRQNDNDRTYENLWNKVKEYNMQIIRWYSWPHILYDTWRKWIQSNMQRNRKAMGIDMEIDECFDREESLFLNNRGYSTPLNDTDMDVDMDVDMDIDTNVG